MSTRANNPYMASSEDLCNHLMFLYRLGTNKQTNTVCVSFFRAKR